MGNLSTATFLVGLAGVTVGGILLFTGAEERGRGSTAFHVLPALGPAQVGLSLRGGF
jgi:hypothetical protein